MRRLRLASHVHSEWSDDCDWPLRRIVRVLRRFGFDGALVCDHDRTLTEDRRRAQVEQCAEISESGFILVPGVEYQDPDHRVHLPVFGDLPFMGRGRTITDVVAECARAGGISVFAHPRRRDAHEVYDPAWLDAGLTGVEVWNRKYDGIRPNDWALDLAREHGLQQFVGLDFHGPRQLLPLAMNVTVDGKPSWGAIISAMRGPRVSSTLAGLAVEKFTDGPAGDIVQRAETLRVKVAPKIRAVERRLGLGSGRH